MALPVAFTYSASANTATFECNLDAAGWSTCPPGGISYPTMTDGPHGFQVRALDGASVDASPASRSWTQTSQDSIQTTPTTTIPPVTTPATVTTQTQTQTAPAPQIVTHYSCPNTPSAIGHYVPAGKHWGNDFVTAGSEITGGHLLIGAASDGGNHEATIGVYTGGPNQLSGELGSTNVAVSGYGGVNFSFSPAIHVSVGESLWLVASGIGDFTGYDQNNGGADGCFIGSLAGTQ
jgi:hypothetical protein